ncbi:MAG TPA: universal stress protein [Chitinophagaceae bacterium]|nr:universal stress protein [Chitinophagaceae bacterium]
MRINKTKKLLIALDYDSSSQRVAEAGFSLAKAIGAEISLIHVVSDLVNYSSPLYSPIMGFGGNISSGFSQSDIIDDQKKISEDFLDQTKKRLNDKNIQTRVKEGDIAESILEAAKELQADIIVLGFQSQKWLEGIFMESITQKLLHHSTVPLFIIPNKKQN